MRSLLRKFGGPIVVYLLSLYGERQLSAEGYEWVWNWIPWLALAWAALAGLSYWDWMWHRLFGWRVRIVRTWTETLPVPTGVEAVNVELEVARKILRSAAAEFRAARQHDRPEQQARFGFRYLRFKEFVTEAFRPHVRVDIDAREKAQRMKQKPGEKNVQEFARCLDEWADKLAAEDMDPDYSPASLESLLKPRP